jgi:two-component system LytT family response regulator
VTSTDRTRTGAEQLRCLIVDDESPARDELRYLLQDFDGVQVVGAAATAEEAEVLLGAVDYDVVFLDIRMPGAGGLDLARRLTAVGGGPQVVFTTAHPDHAVDAFELSAADYLLKPFDSTRLAQALSRVGDRRSESPAAVEPPQPAVEAPGTGRLPVQRGERTVFVDERDLVSASAARGYCYLTLNQERVLVSYTLGELEERLSPRIVRVHRSHLVNLERVAELRSDYHGGLVVIMDDAASTVVPVSRRHGPQLRRRLGR